jgi:hypothetical protein
MDGKLATTLFSSPEASPTPDKDHPAASEKDQINSGIHTHIQ